MDAAGLLTCVNCDATQNIDPQGSLVDHMIEWHLNNMWQQDTDTRRAFTVGRFDAIVELIMVVRGIGLDEAMTFLSEALQERWIARGDS